MKKLINYLKEFSIALLTIIMTYQFRVKADSGFDGDYGGGYSGGYSGDYSSSSSDGEGEIGGAYVIFTIFYMILYFSIRDKLFRKDKNKILEFLFWIFASSINTILVYLIFGIIFMLINILLIFIFTIYFVLKDCGFLGKNKKNENLVINKFDEEDIYKNLGNDFNINEFYNQVFNIYRDIQIAWMNNTLEDVRGLLTDEMFNMYKMQLMTLTSKKEKNMMENIVYKDAYIMDIRQNNDKEEIDVCLTVTCHDYIINTINNKVVRGNKDSIIEYIYKLSFIRSKNTNQINKCSACGAKIPNQMSTKCEYCGSLIIKDSNNYTLASKKIIKQTNRIW